MSIVSFTGHDSISILYFLESYKTSCDHSHVNEGLEIHTLPYFLEASLKQTLIAYMHRIVTYPKFINFLFDKYPSSEPIIQTQDVKKNLQQLPDQHTSNFADFIPSQTNRCGSAYRPIIQIEIFIHGIEHQIGEQTTFYWSDHPDINL